MDENDEEFIMCWTAEQLLKSKDYSLNEMRILRLWMLDAMRAAIKYTHDKYDYRGKIELLKNTFNKE